MRMPWTPEQLSRILLCKSPQDFLEKVIEEKKLSGKPISFASIARSAGFKSRNYPRDVAKGMKFLTMDSAHAVALGLKLNSDLTRFFVLLVDHDNSKRREDQIRTLRLEKKILSLRQRLLASIQASRIDGDAVYSMAETPIVFASLGTPEEGANIHEIQKRSGLSLESISANLSHLIKLNLAREEDDRFYAIANHIGFERLRQEGTFQKAYIERMRTAIKKAEKEFESDQSLFLESSFSVSKEKMPEFKRELRDLLVRFVENQEVPQGNSVASLTCSLFLMN